ncbi:acetolactate synthase large subunit [Streptomyces sp. NPDC018026]|uniref:acetolactate synthase large subunit n=1 Tax=Streptomyces sp. NPDC018026 TaxID=3365031 RepID=UPI0037A81D1F
MNGAQALMESLAASGVGVCFTNPGTSELHLLQALDEHPLVRGVSCLFEGVATGAADGFGRLAPAPAGALLHQGAGLANGLANLHNARRAHTPLVTLVGDAATTRTALDGPLDSDVVALARPMSAWVATATGAADAAAAVRAATRPPGGPATLVVPADVAWSPAGQSVPAKAPHPVAAVAAEVLAATARVLRHGPDTALILGGPALTARGLGAADRIARATGASVITEAFPARLPRGAGLPRTERLSGDPAAARTRLAGTRHVVLAGAARPVAAFAEPGSPGELLPETCAATRLGAWEDDVVSALEALAEELAPRTPVTPLEGRPATVPVTDRPLDGAVLAAVVAAALPEDAVVVDESNTFGGVLSDALATARRHDLLTLCGFAIGQGLPLSIGAALACPERPVLCLEADGSAMYTLSALWTQARESLDITTVVLDNGGYAILRRESRRLLGGGTTPSPLFDIRDPALDFVALSEGMGVPASRAATSGELTEQLTKALAEPGPHLIHATLPALY